MQEKNSTECSDPTIGHLITEYLMGLLEEDKEASFDDHLVHCEFCQLELDKMLPLATALEENQDLIADRLRSEGIHIDQLTTYLSEKSTAEENKFVRWLKSWQKPVVWIPASVAVVAVVALIFTIPRTADEKNPYIKYLDFTQYQVTGSILRGDNEEDQYFNQGVKDYRRGRYLDAVQNFQSSAETDSMEWRTWFLIGVSSYLERNAEAAIIALNRSASLSDGAMRVEISWYLSQAYLLNEQPEQAMPLLKWIHVYGDTYSTKADSLLSYIEQQQE